MDADRGDRRCVVRGLDDAEDGLNEQAFDGALGAGTAGPTDQAQRSDDAWVAELIRRTVAAAHAELATGRR